MSKTEVLWEIKIQQDLSYISFCSFIKDSLQQQINLMATSIGIDAVVVMWFYCFQIRFCIKEELFK